MKQILLVAENEFTMIAKNPIVIIFAGFIFMLALVSIAEYSLMGNTIVYSYDHDTSFYIVIGNLFYYFSLIFAFLAMCVGVMSVAEERSSGSLRLLFTKPLYRRDIILGKFLGICAFLVLSITFTVILFVTMEMIFFGGPNSVNDLI